MKKIFFASMAALFLLASCSKHTGEIEDLTRGSIVKITLADKTPATTRAFFDATAAAESWEKEIKSLTLFVFDASNSAVLRRKFSAAEITRQAVTVAIPDAKPGQKYKFYIIANTTEPGTVTYLDELKITSESAAASYNGIFDEVTVKALRSEGFTMTGSTSAAIAQTGQTTEVQIDLERLVAKIAVQTAPDSKFAALYPGSIRIASATVSRAAFSAVYFNEPQHSGGDVARAAGQDFSHTQASKEQGGKYANLFYVYGNEDTYPSQNVLLTLEGIYDNDGDFATTGDQIPVSYEVELHGDDGKAISRNTYRRVSVSISGLTSADVTVAITPADWEGPYNQDVDLGI